MEMKTGNPAITVAGFPVYLLTSGGEESYYSLQVSLMISETEYSSAASSQKKTIL